MSKVNKEEIKKFIVSNFEVTSDFDDTTDLFENRIVDSIGVIELVNFLEKSFSISIPFETISVLDIKSINQIEIFVNEKIKQNHR